MYNIFILLFIIQTKNYTKIKISIKYDIDNF